MVLKCIARCCCAVKVAQVKVADLYPHRSSPEEAERFC